MLFALNKDSEMTRVSYSKELAICPDCGARVRGHMGKVRPSYWQHIDKSKDCDS